MNATHVEQLNAALAELEAALEVDADAADAADAREARIRAAAAKVRAALARGWPDLAPGSDPS